MQQGVFFVERHFVEAEGVTLAALGHESAFALLGGDQFFELELRQGFAHHRPADRKLFAQLPLAGQLIAGGQPPGVDFATEPVDDFHWQGLVALYVNAFHCESSAARQRGYGHK